MVHRLRGLLKLTWHTSTNNLRIKDLTMVRISGRSRVCCEHGEWGWDLMGQRITAQTGSTADYRRCFDDTLWVQDLREYRMSRESNIPSFHQNWNIDVWRVCFDRPLPPRYVYSCYETVLVPRITVPFLRVSVPSLPSEVETCTISRAPNGLPFDTCRLVISLQPPSDRAKPSILVPVLAVTS